jgi:hypothetical protein
LTKQEMDFRANLLNPNNDLFWTARGLIRPPVLADALAQGHAILKHEGHLTQKQGGRRLSAQFGRSGTGGGSAAPAMVGGGGVGVGFGTGMNAVVGGSVAAVQGSWRSAAPTAVLPSNPAFVTKEDMDTRANQLNPNNDVFWSSRGLIRPPVLADALAQGHAILQHEGHLTQTQTHKTRGRLNSLPSASLYANAAPAPDPRRSISGQGLPGNGGARIGGSYRAAVVGSNAPIGQWQAGNAATRRRASTTGSLSGGGGGLPAPLGLDSALVTKDEVDLRANLMNPNNSVFWTSRGLTRPADLQEALAKGHAVLEAEGHTTHAQGGRSKSSSSSSGSTWTRRGSRTEPPAMVSPLVAAAQRQWSTPFLAPNAGSTLPPSGRSGGLPGAAWVGGGAPVGLPVPTRHPDWQPASYGNAAQRRRYSLPPPGFELFTPPSHFGLFRPPQQLQQQQPIVREGAADSEWDKMDESSFVVRPPLAPQSAAIPIIKPPPGMGGEAAKKSGDAGAWVRKEPSKDQKKSGTAFLQEKREEKESKEAKKMKEEDQKMKREGEKKEDVEMKDVTMTSPSEPTTPASEQQQQKTKVGSLAWQLTQVKLKTAGEARESESSSKSATV